MSRYWSPELHQLTPYVPGEQPKVDNLIKLNTNEHPMAPSPAVATVLHQFDIDRLRLYPDPDSSRLKEALAKQFNLSPEWVFVGNGSDEVLAHVFMAFFRQSKPLLMPEFTYSFYPVYCQLYGINYHPVPLDEAFRIQLQDYIQPNGGVIFANPNAPSGIALTLAEIEHFLKQNPDSVVVCDEAYVDFGAQSAVELLQRYPNLLVIQTFSKSRALAGMRVGYALGDPELIAGLERVKNSFNSYPLDMLAQETALAALSDEAYFSQQIDTVIANREWTASQLKELGFHLTDSKTNFLFITHPTLAAADLADYLRNRNILVRHFKHPGIDNYLRVSIGSQAEMETFIRCLHQHPQLA